MADAVIYPPQIKKDKDKLLACYSLIRQMIDEYNRQSAIAATDKETYDNKFRTYTQEQFEPRLKQLFSERNGLMEAIRWGTYSKQEWQQISQLSIEEQRAIHHALFGDKPKEKVKPTLATSPILDELKSVSLDSLSPSFGDDPTEDLSSYTEQDESSDVTITADRVTHDTMDSKNVNTYVYKDKGSAHFDGDFEHRFQTRYSLLDNSALYDCWMLANGVGNRYYLHITSPADYLAADCLGESAGDDSGVLREFESGNHYLDEDTGITENTTYYITVKRDEAVGTYGTLYAYYCTGNYYGESGSSTVIALSLTLHAKIDFQYFYVLNVWDASATGYSTTGYSEYFDLQEAAPTFVPRVAGVV